jgi:DNA-binding transcriptional LysR family regulator
MAGMSAEPLNTDRIALLDTFMRIVDAGNLSAAAAQMGMTQATVSRRLQGLERLLGVRLLNRSTHLVSLTEDGARCYERAKELLLDWEAFESDIKGEADEPAGLLRVLAPHALGQQQLIGPLMDYLRQYPGMTVEWLLTDRMPNFISEGIDCAIRIGEVTEPNVIALRLGDVPRIVVAAPSLLEGRLPPTTPEQLGQLPWLALQGFYRDEVTLSHARTGKVARFPIRPRLATDSLYAQRGAALVGLGAAILSSWAVIGDLDDGQLVHLAPDWEAAALPVYLVYPPARFQPARLRKFIDIMRTALPDLVRQTAGVAPRHPR